MKNTRKKLKEIAKSKGFRTKAGSDFQIVFFGATITTDNNLGPRVWEWRMLHELGHAELILRKERCHINTLVRVANMPDYKPTEAFYRDYLDMEWKAWEQGMVAKLLIQRGADPFKAFKDPQKIIEFFKGDIDWMEEPLKTKLKRMQRGKSAFGM